MKTRMRFTKTGSMKYIGHLDCMRFFQKAIRRAKIDVAYSKGYSPHQLMSFASPLGVGITSDGEYLDVEFNSLPELTAEELIDYLNGYLTDEIFVTEIERMPDTFKNSMSLLNACDYMIVEKKKGVFFSQIEKQWAEFINQPEIMVTKKTKRSTQEIDIRPHIRCASFSLEDFCRQTGQTYGKIHCPQEGNTLFVQLTSGSETNIKPDLVWQAFCAFCGRELPPYSCHIHRLQMYFD